jgi:hypothetical protein
MLTLLAPHRRHVMILALTGVFAAPTAHARSLDAPCPPSRYSLGGTPEVVTTAPTLDTSVDSFGIKHVAFDLPAGTLEMDQCCSLLHTYVLAADAYDVAGLPTGTVVTLTASLSVDGSVSTTGCGGSGCGGVFVDSLYSGVLADTRSHAIGVFNGSVPFHDDLTLPVTIVAGTPVVIQMRFEGFRSPGGSHASQGTGVLRFSGVPAGAAVISCQGYASGPTPTERASWGRLKLVYR